MKISDVMTADVEAVNPDDTLRTAAELMANLDSSQLPVGENNLLIGAITDHDITIQAVVEGRDPGKTTVRQAMSDDVLYCFEDEDVADEVRQPEPRAQIVGDETIRRTHEPVAERRPFIDVEADMDCVEAWIGLSEVFTKMQDLRRAENCLDVARRIRSISARHATA